MTTAGLVDDYIAARGERYAADRRVFELREREGLLESALINTLRERGDTEVVGSTGTVTLTSYIEPMVQDWDAVQRHVRTTGDFSLLHRRLVTLVVKEHWEAGETIPGIGARDVFGLRVSAS